MKPKSDETLCNIYIRSAISIFLSQLFSIIYFLFVNTALYLAVFVDYHNSSTVGTTFYFYFSIAQLISKLIYSKLKISIPIQYSYMICSFICLVATTVCVFIKGIAVIIVICIGCGLTMTLLYAQNFAVAMTIFPKRHESIIIGIVSFMSLCGPSLSVQFLTSSASYKVDNPNVKSLYFYFGLFLAAVFLLSGIVFPANAIKLKNSHASSNSIIQASNDHLPDYKAIPLFILYFASNLILIYSINSNQVIGKKRGYSEWLISNLSTWMLMLNAILRIIVSLFATPSNRVAILKVSAYIAVNA